MNDVNGENVQIDDAYVLGDIDAFMQALEDGVFEKEWNRLRSQLTKVTQLDAAED